MARTESEDGVIVGEVVAALTGPVEGETPTDLRAQMERAAKEFDGRTADSFCRALLAHLSDDPAQVRELEALVILGLAHPDLLERHRIPLVREGRRLAVLLERSGDAQRAQTLLELISAHSPGDRAVDRELTGVMRRNGNLDRLVERHLRRAEEATREGNRKEAVRWLAAVLALDPSRRDVARMIRDLRYAEGERRRQWLRRIRIGAAAAVIALAVSAVTWRELQVERAYAELADAREGDVAGMEARLRAIDEFVGEHVAWLGLFEASRERSRLRLRIDEVVADRARVEREAASAHAHRAAAAEAARARGRLAAEQRDFETALTSFRTALELAPDGWAHRERVAADVAAIVDWRSHPRPPGAEEHR